MPPISRLIVINLARLNQNAIELAGVFELDGQAVAADYDGNSMVWIDVPGHGLARLKNQTPNEDVAVSVEDFLKHRGWGRQ